jgi:hypothetical protein
MRHGRKSKSHCFKGHKASIGVDGSSQIIVAVDVLKGNAADATGALEMVEMAEEMTGQPVDSTTGDCAYGGGPTREEFENAGRELVARVPMEADRGVFGKSQFAIDLEAGTVTCPGGCVAERVSGKAKTGMVHHFGKQCQKCPLRERCTKSARGRSIHIHPQEELIAQARAFQKTEEALRLFKARQTVEHTLARLARLGIGKSRYKGIAKTLFQLLMSAAVVNFRRTWNWVESRPNGPETGTGTPNEASASQILGQFGVIGLVLTLILTVRVCLLRISGCQKTEIGLIAA